MKALRDVNYGGLVAIEYEHDGPVEDEVRQEVDTRGRFCGIPSTEYRTR